MEVAQEASAFAAPPPRDAELWADDASAEPQTTAGAGAAPLTTVGMKAAPLAAGGTSAAPLTTSGAKAAQRQGVSVDIVP